jgi:5-enolpyruvylshikimate-3-phosphate synthase
MASSGSEWPFLALAACFAEGESILRIPSENQEVFKQELEDFAINFRKTGAEIGVYDYGIVLRGKEELDGGDFEAFSKPVLGLTLFVFSFLGRGHSSINNIESLETEFSGLTQKLKQLLKGEPDEVS